MVDAKATEWLQQQAVWDESHAQPILDVIRMDRLKGDAALQRVEQDLREYVDGWLRQTRSELSELGITRQTDIDAAYVIYTAAYMTACRKRMRDHEHVPAWWSPAPPLPERGGHRSNPAHTRNSVRHFAELQRAAWRWGHAPEGAPHVPSSALEPYLKRVPRGASVDRQFWAGELVNDVIADARRTLTAAQFREFTDAVDLGQEEYDARDRNLRRFPRQAARHNPGVDPAEQEAAVAKYKEFHRQDPVKIGEFGGNFAIPKHVYRAGKCLWTTYRSTKVDPSTLRKPRKPVNYIHEHDAGVMLYVVDAGELDAETPLERVAVPREFQQVEVLTRLGHNLGYKFVLEGNDLEAEAVEPLPELYCTPDGKCLLVVQSKRTVIAMMWGGALGVFARGIDG